MLNRRELLQKTSQAGAAAFVASRAGQSVCAQEKPTGILVNDRQSQLNETRVARIEQPASLDEVQATLAKAAKENKPVSLCGGRHAMGGQQFGADTVLIDTGKLNRVLKLDREKRTITAQAGIQWPELLDYLHTAQKDDQQQLSIRQKQTGVDQVSLGGTLAANAHGRGLRFPPIAGDVESFVLVDAAGKAHHCSRTENAELFSLAIGGYGLFGIVTEVTLRLVPRQKVERVVKLLPIQDLIESVEARVKDGFLYGDCQYNTSVEGDDPHQGVFSCYRPVADSTRRFQRTRSISRRRTGASCSFWATRTARPRFSSMPTITWRRADRFTGPTRTRWGSSSATTTSRSTRPSERSRPAPR